ncbi:hypothetical protein EVAR_83218_1 [Eumeta japonica]|uniref:Uncharacterized protein n=1 Tax=Eumeta variegata TaxID=151549 RepID=A0A4C1Y2Z4_EUMVA|nr:hypothetical protein EVAR_83218_1 [Eumeta japonica]
MVEWERAGIRRASLSFGDSSLRYRALHFFKRRRRRRERAASGTDDLSHHSLSARPKKILASSVFAVRGSGYWVTNYDIVLGAGSGDRVRGAGSGDRVRGAADGRRRSRPRSIPASSAVSSAVALTRNALTAAAAYGAAGAPAEVLVLQRGRRPRGRSLPRDQLRATRAPHNGSMAARNWDAPRADA